MRALAFLLLLLWIIGSTYYVIQGHKTRKEAVGRIEDEREGKVVPVTTKAEALLPKSLEERLHRLAAEEGTTVAPMPAGTGDGPSASPPPPPPPSSTSPDPAAADDAAAAGAPSAGGASIFDAAPPPRPAGERTGPPPGTPTVATALAGVTLPCDLVPLVSAGTVELDEHRLAFVTRGHPPTALALALRDELVAAGFTFTTTGPMTATATRDGLPLHLEVFDTPSGVVDAGVKRFATAAIDAIVVEISTY